MRPILFIDRDGTIISETEDEFVDQIEKLHFLPDVLYYLRKIQQESHFLLVLVSNQDGLGTEGHQEKRFYPIHNLIMRTLSLKVFISIRYILMNIMKVPIMKIENQRSVCCLLI